MHSVTGRTQKNKKKRVICNIYCNGKLFITGGKSKANTKATKMRIFARYLAKIWYMTDRHQQHKKNVYFCRIHTKIYSVWMTGKQQQIKMHNFVQYPTKIWHIWLTDQKTSKIAYFCRISCKNMTYNWPTTTQENCIFLQHIMQKYDIWLTGTNNTRKMCIFVEYPTKYTVYEWQANNNTQKCVIL